jgi:hypothetical protein
MTLFLRVTPTGMPAFRSRDPAAAQLPTEVTKSHAVFADLIKLEGYDIDRSGASGEESQTVEVTLFWRALRRPDLQYTVFVHALDSNGELLAQNDSMPMDNALPTSCWARGELIEDTHRLTSPAEATELRVGLYYWPTMDRLSLSTGESAVFLPVSPTKAEE